jgi:XTP/dITP diphosphohydrolase
MKKTIYLVTGNPKKVKIAQEALKPYDIAVRQIDLETPEIQSLNTEDVAKFSVKYAADKIGKTVIKGDFGMYIEALNGFPGPFPKFINKWFNSKQFVNLYKDEKNMKAYFIDALAYCQPKMEPICFVTKTYGKLTTKPQGDNGNMIDSVFIPNGFNKTLASFNEMESIKFWSNNRYEQLANYLNSKRNIN